MSYQPFTGQPCSCKRGVQRDNCPSCEGTGRLIDFKKIRERNAMTKERAKYILGRVWGSLGTITAAEARELDAVATTGETYLDTALRVAGLELDWKAIPTFEGRSEALRQLLGVIH